MAPCVPRAHTHARAKPRPVPKVARRPHAAPALLSQVPLGVVLAIPPYNYSINLSVR